MLVQCVLTGKAQETYSSFECCREWGLWSSKIGNIVYESGACCQRFLVKEKSQKSHIEISRLNRHCKVLKRSHDDAAGHSVSLKYYNLNKVPTSVCSDVLKKLHNVRPRLNVSTKCWDHSCMLTVSGCWVTRRMGLPWLLWAVHEIVQESTRVSLNLDRSVSRCLRQWEAASSSSQRHIQLSLVSMDNANGVTCSRL